MLCCIEVFVVGGDMLWKSMSAEFGVFEVEGLFVSSHQEPGRGVRVHIGRESMCETQLVKPNYYIG